VGLGLAEDRPVGGGGAGGLRSDCCCFDGVWLRRRFGSVALIGKSCQFVDVIKTCLRSNRPNVIFSQGYRPTAAISAA